MRKDENGMVMGIFGWYVLKYVVHVMVFGLGLGILCLGKKSWVGEKFPGENILPGRIIAPGLRVC